LTTDGVDEDREHNEQNQLTGVGSNTLTYDANGNLTTHPGEPGGVSPRSLVWDAWNRLVEVKDEFGATIVRYEIDAQGWRISEDDGVSVRDFFYSTGWQLLEEVVDGETVIQYVWSPVYVDAMVLRDRDTDDNGTLDERLYVVHDANFNVTALVDINGDVVERFAYDPYGVFTVYDASWMEKSATDFAWQYLHQGLRFEEETGLYHNRMREYSPTLMRFVSVDHLPGITNLYPSRDNRPTDLLDYLGLQPLYTELTGAPIRPPIPAPYPIQGSLRPAFVGPSTEGVLNRVYRGPQFPDPPCPRTAAVYLVGAGDPETRSGLCHQEICVEIRASNPGGGMQVTYRCYWFASTGFSVRVNPYWIESLALHYGALVTTPLGIAILPYTLVVGAGPLTPYEGVVQHATYRSLNQMITESGPILSQLAITDVDARSLIRWLDAEVGRRRGYSLVGGYNCRNFAQEWFEYAQRTYR
jgi:RHS repeat-associated protein